MGIACGWVGGGGGEWGGEGVDGVGGGGMKFIESKLGR